MGGLTIERIGTLGDVTAAAWDAVVGDGCPFFEHGFLHSLERAGCVGPGTGWLPRYVLARRDGRLAGALPLYGKQNSFGEYIFDWAWADAARRARIPYYPKMVVAAPFSPVGGARFLLAPGEGDEAREALLRAARSQAEGTSGLHWLFVTADEADFLERRGLAVRHTHQFQWHDEGYRDFEDFLSRFRSDRRNQIRRERKRVREAGVEIEVLEGDEIRPEHVELVWTFYEDTIDKFSYGQLYLNRRFFELLYDHWRPRMQLVLARRGRAVLGGAFNARKGDVQYGRYWGCSPEGGEVPFLHFEVCSYAGIEAAIARGVKRFEAGAGGGGHKFGRGFLPTLTYSAHELAHPGLDAAVRGFLAQEKVALADEMEVAEGLVLKPR
jgi:predicted N-acyltransferase